MNPLCELFANLSGWVWKAISDSRAYYNPTATGFREVSITDFLLLYLHRHGVRYHDCMVYVPSEIQTGADLELLIVENGVATHFRMQAKRIRWQNRRYPDVGHAPPKSPLAFQIDTLCTPSTGFVPMYLFYNWYEQGQTDREKKLLWKQGCCIASALQVRRLLGKPYSRDLDLSLASPHEVPWTRLVCPPKDDVDLSLHALEQADSLGARDGVDFGTVRRPISGDYERLWASGGDASRLSELRFERPIVMIGRPGSVPR